LAVKKLFKAADALIVESLEFKFEALDSEFLMDGIIVFDTFIGGPKFHWDDFNVVAVINITDHDV
jgi:hypothetical protein